MSSFWRRPKSEPLAPTERSADPLRVVRAYHEATKHDHHRYAAGPPDLDWDTQPDPYRRFEGAELVALERCEPTDGRPWYEESFCAGRVAPAPLTRATLSQLFFDSLALSGSKRYGAARWSLRCNPSSGNLHPTEGYLVSGPLEGVSATALVAHYAPREHALEVRARVPSELWRELSAGLAPGAFLIGLTSIHWRESWKYGERAFRYCQHDVGHALGALAVAAAALGWRARVLDEPSSAELALLLGTASQRGIEAEHADVLIAIETRPVGGVSLAPTSEAFARCAAWSFAGTPNELSSGHIDWPVIDAVAEATHKPRTQRARTEVPLAAPWIPGDEPIPLRRIVRARRSAVAFDGRSSVARDAFEQALRRTLPREGDTVLACWPYEPLVDLLLFVHRIEGLAPGLYLLLRDPRREDRWRAAAGAQHEWTRVEAEGLALWRLKGGDARSLARSLSCQQDIAADGCFSLGMLAQFREPLESRGPWFYRRLFWECGLIGQLLYLEAEALGLRGTGIGCFFDDPVHRTLGLAGDAFQSLYHFTVGGAVEDPRIESGPAYADPE